MAAAPRVHGVEQRNAQVVGDRQAHERPRQLEAARQAEMRALVRRQAVERLAVEAHRAGLVVQRAADAVDQRRSCRSRSARSGRARSPGCDVEVDAVERDEAAEALAEILDLSSGSVISALPPHVGKSAAPIAAASEPLRMKSCTRPTMPFGATMTKATSSTPTISRLTAEEIVTVATCCSDAEQDARRPAGRPSSWCRRSSAWRWS